MNAEASEEEFKIVWEPDTCECVITYTRNFTKSKALKKCKLHAHVPDDQIFQAVLEHNRSFNLRVFDAADKARDEMLREQAKAAEKARSKPT